MSEGTTPEQRLLEAVKAAGLDPDKPFSEQLGTPEGDDDRESLTARVAELEAELEAAKTKPDPERDFAQGLATRLHDSQSPWFSFGGTDAA